jgi:hypothetical protein
MERGHLARKGRSRPESFSVGFHNLERCASAAGKMPALHI